MVQRGGKRLKQPPSSSSSPSAAALITSNQLLATQDAAILHPHQSGDTTAAPAGIGTTSSSSSILKELYRIQPEDPTKPDLSALKEVASVYWGTSLVVDLDSISIPSIDDLLELLKAFAHRAKQARSPMGQLHLTNIAILDSLEGIRALVDAVREVLSTEEDGKESPPICQILFLSIQCSPEETIQLESLCLSIANEVIFPAKGGPRAVSRLTAEEQIDASRIKCQVDVDASRDQTTTVGDTGEESAPAELSQVENVPNNIDKGSLGLDDIALVQCDHCHRRRFVNNATAQWVAHLSDFSCSMLEGSQCTADDDWPLALSPSTAPSRTAEAARPSVRATGQKRNRSKSREAQLDMETPVLSAPSVANKKRKTTPRSRPKVLSHAENVEARDAAEIAGTGEANETVKSEIPAPKETIHEIEKDKQPRRRNRRSVEAGTQALFLSLLTPIIQHSASVLLLAQDAPPKSHKEVLAIPDSCFEEEVAVTDLLELLRKSDISSLRFVKFPAGDCRFVRVFNQDHMESFVDILAKFHNITHVDFGGIATTAAGSELQTWRPLSRGFSHTGVSHLCLNHERMRPPVLRAIQSGLAKTQGLIEKIRQTQGVSNDELDKVARPYYPPAWIPPSGDDSVAAGTL
ncbi:hypothetical protein Pmar_PMAR019001 [Perkinsus marinus ATCC 50983]|uniref:Uncharacterized protein n=1 Tax=Perkinsus marinus (strain ATCC 50983 / TXsc) TaxID=423536 RepID=C5KY15_PERM5|nr:hypothetical protein Pmar_PMAR019001 [Perkinsus marinus ATCC 50983]EER10622.1 hypothetical protein Pmar_PMAR019001 [Perkinsus marinus ATCC 50983]|eukprot:XP_002778827.1 hypothetical protein Pmar_PMAR019001 [Perkinsus marinus ATCC 50983]